MSINLLIIVFISIFSVDFLFANAYAIEPTQAKAANIYRVGDWTTFQAKWLIGHEVLGSAGAKVGKISDLVIDQENNRIALVVLSEVPGLGSRHLLIPFSALARTSENSFQVGFRERELTDPSANSNIYQIPGQIDPAWVATIYARYGQDAYWTKPGQKSLSSLGLYTASRLLRADFRSPEGQIMAKTNDLVIDSRDGRIVFLGLSDVSGKGSALVAVPFNLVTKGEETVSLSAASLSRD